MIDKKNIESRLSALADGEKVEVTFITDLKDRAHLVEFTCDGFLHCSCVVYDDGSLFHLRDWQAAYPHTAREVKEFEYLTEDGRDAVMFNGLPRSLK